MAFMTAPGPRVVPPSGPVTAKVAIIGEAPGSYENQQLKPFVGPAGSVLEQCLHAAGLIRSEVYVTNVVKTQPKGNDIAPYFNTQRGGFTELGKQAVAELHEELSGVQANVLVACGATAFAALTGQHKIMKYRGYFFESQEATPRKVMPTIHPAAALRGMYIYRHIIAADLKKARQHSDSPTLVRPDRQLVYNWANVGEVLQWLEYYESAPRLSVDIEVRNFEVSCIGLSSDPSIAISVPFDSRWSEIDELSLWRGVQRVLATSCPKVGQNLIFDTHFLLTRYGLEVKGPIEDTMIAHSVLYPELRKGLDFLGSMYCGTQEFWKDKVSFSDNIKEES